MNQILTILAYASGVAAGFALGYLVGNVAGYNRGMDDAERWPGRAAR